MRAVKRSVGAVNTLGYSSRRPCRITLSLTRPPEAPALQTTFNRWRTTFGGSGLSTR